MEKSGTRLEVLNNGVPAPQVPLLHPLEFNKVTFGLLSVSVYTHLSPKSRKLEKMPRR